MRKQCSLWSTGGFCVQLVVFTGEPANDLDLGCNMFIRAGFSVVVLHGGHWNLRCVGSVQVLFLGVRHRTDRETPPVPSRQRVSRMPSCLTMVSIALPVPLDLTMSATDVTVQARFGPSLHMFEPLCRSGWIQSGSDSYTTVLAGDASIIGVRGCLMSISTSKLHHAKDH